MKKLIGGVKMIIEIKKLCLIRMGWTKNQGHRTLLFVDTEGNFDKLELIGSKDLLELPAKTMVKVQAGLTQKREDNKTLNSLYVLSIEPANQEESSQK